MNRYLRLVACGTCLLSLNSLHASIVINELVYDDGGTDDREFVELYNNGNLPVDIGGWTLGGQDQVGPNPSVTIATGTVLNPMGFYVMGQAGVFNVNQVVAASFLENDAETVELRNAGVLMDAVVYESNRGPTTLNPFNGGYGTLPAEVLANVGTGIWGNNQAVDLAGAPLMSSVSLGRFVDGRDTNNNGRDFGYRPNTPGANNNPLNITNYRVPNVAMMPVGSNLTGFAYSAIPPRVINPAIPDADNPNAILPSPISPDRAVIAWDPSGGGHGASARETFVTSQSKFDIFAYLDTRDLPQMTNSTGAPFRGSEITVYGIGSTDALSGLTDISGQIGTPDTSNGTTGIAWVYEKVAAPNPADAISPSNMVSEKLYLVDAKDGGDAGQGGPLAFDWTILAAVDLSNTPSGWYRLAIAIDALGNGVARFRNQSFSFTTAQHSGAFCVAYRENAQIGTMLVPGQYLRPPTFVDVPEPEVSVLAAIGLWVAALAKAAGRRRASL